MTVKHVARRGFPALSLPLSTQLVGVLTVFTLLVTATVTGVDYVQGRRAVQAEGERRLAADGRVAADRIARDLADRERALAIWPSLEVAQDIAVEDVDKRLAMSLQRLAAPLGAGDLALAADPQGRIVASSRAETIGRFARELPLVAGAACPAGDTIQQTLVRHPRGDALRFSARIASRVGGGTLGCLHLVVRLDALVQHALPEELRAHIVLASGGELLWRGALHAGTAPERLVSGEGTRVAGPLPLTTRAFERRDILLAPLDQRRRSAIVLALAVVLVTAPAVIVVARHTARPLTALTAAAATLGGDAPIALPSPGSGAPREVHLLREALQAMIERLERSRVALAEREALASLGTMAASLAHEIRTPLAVLHGSAELLGRPQPPARAEELSSLLQAEVRRLERLVDDLLAFARPRAPARAAGDLADVARRAAATLAPAAAAREVRLDVKALPAAATFDTEQMLQVALNLGANAIQASSPHASVTVATGTAAGEAWLSVSDHGPGIPVAQRRDIFRPFFTTRPHGSGLGLAIVKQVADAHGARLLVESGAEGTTMRLSLPVLP